MSAQVAYMSPQVIVPTILTFVTLKLGHGDPFVTYFLANQRSYLGACFGNFDFPGSTTPNVFEPLAVFHRLTA